MKTIPYTDPALHYAGRWRDAGDGKDSGWQGAQVRFKVSGSSVLRVTAKVLDTNGTDVCFAAFNIDGGATEIRSFTTAAGSGSGLITVELALPGTGVHTVVLKMACYPVSQWDGSSYCRLVSLQVDDSGSVQPWGGQGRMKVQVVGDSWMGAQSDWPRLLGLDDFDIYPVSFGGATMPELNSKYLYDRAGFVNASDPSFDLILINASVNDYYQGVPLSSYQWHLEQLLGKARAAHPQAEIRIIGSPRNNLHSIDYQKYLPAMQAAAASFPGVQVVPIPAPVWSTLQWAEQYHLTQAGLETFAAYVRGQLPVPPLLFDAGAVSLELEPAGQDDAKNVPCVLVEGSLYRLRARPAGTLMPGTVYMRVGLLTTELVSRGK